MKRPPGAATNSLFSSSLVLVDLGLVLVNRSFTASPFRAAGRGNRTLRWVSGVTVAILAAVLIWRAGRDLFHFGPLHADDLTLVAGVVASVVIVLEVLKPFWRERLTF